MHYSEALADFNENFLPAVIERYGEDDQIAINEEWSYYIDSLSRDGQITNSQVSAWCYDDAEDDDDLIEWHLGQYGVGVIISPIASRTDNLGWCSSTFHHYRADVVYNSERKSFEYSQGSSLNLPTVADVVSCLMTDASSVSGYDDSDCGFEAWCDDMGYDSDSRKAHRSFMACHETRNFFHRILTTEEFDELEELTQQH